MSDTQNKMQISGMNREIYTIPANSIKTINYSDVDPNYFHIQNNGGSAIYFSTHGIPTTHIYDMKIDGGSISTFTDPYPQSEVYIFNPYDNPVNVIITSFRAPFDPVVLASMNKQFTVGGSIETDGIVKSFDCQLPAGTNHLGKVEVTKLPTGAFKLTDPLPYGNNKIGSVEVNFSSLIVKLDEIINSLNNDSNESQLFYYKEEISVSGIHEVLPPEGYYFSKIINITAGIEGWNTLNATATLYNGTEKIMDLSLVDTTTMNANCHLSKISCDILINDGADDVPALIAVTGEIKKVKNVDDDDDDKKSVLETDIEANSESYLRNIIPANASDITITQSTEDGRILIKNVSDNLIASTAFNIPINIDTLESENGVLKLVNENSYPIAILIAWRE